jgi:branched-chain amino acid aminotransferase
MSTKLSGAEWIWKDGTLIPWGEAQVHLLSLAVQFGSSVFEGIRCYKTEDGPAIFRLHDHLRRLYRSCAIYRMSPEVGMDELVDACRLVVRENGLEDAYIRPMVLWGYGAAGMNPVGSPLETYVATWNWGAYLGEGALENGVDVCVSSWQRPAPNTLPVLAKSAGHYNNAQLMKMEAVANGYAEAIALSPSGLVSEGSGQNLFLVRDGVVVTPPLGGTALEGITRDTVIALAQEAGLELRCEAVARESLYTADELFFTGTASEVTPIRSVDRITVGEGRAGPVTRQLQQAFMDVVRGRVPDTHGWLTGLGSPAAAQSGS